MEDNRKRYKAQCPICGKEFYACKSIAQEMGMDDGWHGSCPKCSTFLNLTFVPELEEMKATEWNEWLAKREK